MSRPVVKICGIARSEDVVTSTRFGADYFGSVIEVPYSKRSVSLEEAEALFRDASLPGVALVVNRKAEEIIQLTERLAPHAVQLAGDEPPELVQDLRPRVSAQIWKTLHLPTSSEPETGFEEVLGLARLYQEAGVDWFIVDAITVVEGQVHHGGTGKTCDWDLACGIISALDRPCLIAGGIRPDNARAALEASGAVGVDCSSGVEKEPGKKDPAKIRLLIHQTRNG